MATRATCTARVSLFSDGVFAVLITILVLELKPPHADNFGALLPLWPTGLSYAVSYLFMRSSGSIIIICSAMRRWRRRG